jgi:predicted DNA-binding transcriptional regulator AlpA
MDATKWKAGGKEQVLQTYVNLHKHKLFGEHWLWVALERVAAGENEAEVMRDYGYTISRKANRMAPLIRINAIALKMGDVHPSFAWKKLASDPDAPKPIKLGERLTVFDEAEVDRWIAGMVEAAKHKPAKRIAKKTAAAVAA